MSFSAASDEENAWTYQEKTGEHRITILGVGLMKVSTLISMFATILTRGKLIHLSQIKIV